MVLTLQLYAVYVGFIMGFSRRKRAARETHRTCAPTSRVNLIFCEAGFRPGRRAWCLVRPRGRNRCCGGKGPKTSDAPSGLIRWGERWLGKDGPTRSVQTRPANLFERSPLGPDGRPRTMGDEHFRPHMKEPGNVISSNWQGSMGRHPYIIAYDP